MVIIINLLCDRNVVKNYKKTGYLWEQYDQKKGNGKGARLFTGWTSLIVLIMAETYSDCQGCYLEPYKIQPLNYLTIMINDLHQLGKNYLALLYDLHELGKI